MQIFLFDPSRHDQAGNFSTNLGDLIIRKAVDAVLIEVFPRANIVAASTKEPLSETQLHSALRSDLVLIGGTNLLSSHVLAYDQWKLSASRQHYAEPVDLRAVLLSVGWWQYQDAPDIVTRHYYRRLLNRSLPHSTRDAYTKTKLAECGIENVINTSCVTLWGLNGRSTARFGNRKRCLFTLTDYRWDIEADNSLVDLLLERYDELLFFPQGSSDLEYASNIPAITKAGSRITLLPHEIDAFYDATVKGDCDYIGTRLHAGAQCLQSGLPSLILGVDNRSLEIAKDINLAVFERHDTSAISAWIDGTLPEKKITLPEEAILEWKNALRLYADSVSSNAATPASNEKIGIWRRVKQKISSPPEPRLLNLGYGGRVHPAWINVDFAACAPGVITHDLTTPLPFRASSFTAVYASHVLEHIPVHTVSAFLSECAKVLAPGGIIRIVVPDFELLAQMYLKALSEIDSGDSAAYAKRDYIMINMIDQLSRNYPGGEMLRFWQQNPMPCEDFIVALNGLEVLNTLVDLRISGDTPSEALREKYSSAEMIGGFRKSGEPHAWMYDRISLARALEAAGFKDARQCAAHESRIERFADFCLDTTLSGEVRKPDSLFFEAVREPITQAV